MSKITRLISIMTAAASLGILGALGSLGAGPAFGCPTEVDANGNVTAIDIRVGASPSLQVEDGQAGYLLRPAMKEKRKLLRLEVSKDGNDVVLSVTNNTDFTVSFDVQSLEETGWVSGIALEVKHGDKLNQHFTASTLRVRLSRIQLRPSERPTK